MDTTTAVRPLTIDDLPDEDYGPRHELVDGGLIVTPNPTVRHQWLVQAVVRELDRHAGSDVVVLPGVNVIADPSTLVIPDIAVVTAEAVARDELGVSPTDLVLVVEVESPSTRRRDRSLKRDLYAEWGVPYYLVDPVLRTVAVFGAAPLPLDAEAIFTLA